MKPLLSAVFICVLLLGFSSVQGSDFKIDDQFPGGNIIVRSVTGDKVLLAVDRRGSDRGECSWRHWFFRVTGAQGRTLQFEFEKDRTSDVFGHVTTRGPMVSRDDRLTWTWFSDGKPFNPPNSFEYKFGENEKIVYFTAVPPYTEETLHRFLKAIDTTRGNFRLTSLCKTEKGRSVELIRFGSEKNPGKIGIVICARHHANEIVSDFVIEGIIKEAFSGSDAGNFILTNADFFIVPFVDKDGVEAGEQGKSLIPHDHNRDYIKRRYSTIRAIEDQTLIWGKDKKIFLFDFHANSLDHRGRRLNDPNAWSHHMFFFVHTVKSVQYEKAFGLILKDLQKNKRILYDGKSDTLNKKVTPSMSHNWFYDHLNAIFSCSSEVPSCGREGMPYSIEEYHELGANIVRALAISIRDLKR